MHGIGVEIAPIGQPLIMKREIVNLLLVSFAMNVKQRQKEEIVKNWNGNKGLK